MALADDSAPVSLLPQTASPPAPAAAPPKNTVANTDTDDTNPVKSGSLSPPPLDALGLLDPGHGGLPATLWVKTDRHEVLSLLAALPVGGTSPARTRLTRRLLLTAAPPPTVADGEVQPADAGSSSLLTLRIGRLLKMGATDDVRALIAAMPPSPDTDAASTASASTGGPGNDVIQKAAVESYLIDNDVDQACRFAGDANRQTNDPYWLKVLVFCDLVGGNHDKAALELSLLGEEKVDDPVFAWAAEQLSGNRVVTLDGFDNPQPLTLAMVRATGRGYPAGTLVDAAPWLLRAVALTGKAKVDPEIRVAAAETAARNGGMSLRELSSVFDAVEAPSSEARKTADDIAAHPSARGDAWLWQMAASATDTAAQANLVGKALDAAERQGWYLQAANLYAPLIERIPPSATLVGFAEPAARALLVAGHFPAAFAWYHSLQQQAGESPRAAEARNALWPLVRLAGGDNGTSLASRDGTGLHPANDPLAAWQQVIEARLVVDSDDDAHEPVVHRTKRLQTKLLSLLTALGEPVSLAEWSNLWSDSNADPGFTPTASRWQAERVAARNHQSGATVALALMMLSGADPGEESEIALSSAVEGLHKVGLDTEAREIAVESAVAAGL